LNSEKKKIIYITVRSDFGGGPYHVDLLISNLKDSFDIYIAAPLNKPYGIKWKAILGETKFFELPFRSFKIGTLLKLRSFIKNNRIEILHAHGKGAGLYGRLTKILLPDIFVIYTFHGFHILNYNPISRIVYIIFERFLSGFTNLFINVSKGEQDTCLKLKIYRVQKSVIIYNAIKNIPNVAIDKSELRNKLNLPADKFITSSVARFNMQKNLKASITIAAKLLENHDVIFLIIGDGEERENIEYLIESSKLSNVLLTGYKSNVNEYLVASDIYLSTSLWEGLPYSLIEASARGLPIVASDVTGNNEVVVDGVNGYLFNLNNPDDAVEKILRIKNSIQEQMTLGENSIKIFMENFQLDAMINKMKDTYKSININQK
jgi:glycosyltransferase involved in cell wall biosynthesis